MCSRVYLNREKRERQGACPELIRKISSETTLLNFRCLDMSYLIITMICELKWSYQ